MKFLDGDYILAFWFVGGAGCEQDWFATVLRRADATNWEMEYRWRYYSEKSHDPFDGEDKKSFWHATCDKLEQEMLQIVDNVARMICAKFKTDGGSPTVDRVLVQGPFERAVELMTQRPWAHVRQGGEA